MNASSKKYKPIWICRGIFSVCIEIRFSCKRKYKFLQTRKKMVQGPFSAGLVFCLDFNVSSRINILEKCKLKKRSSGNKCN